MLSAVVSAGAPAEPIDYKTAKLDRKLPAVRTTGAISIDGRLDEPQWESAPLASRFIQNEPREGEPATMQTDVRVLYDAEFLYLGVFNHDNEPHKAIVNELKEDFNVVEGDLFGVVLDPFHDERNGYQFEVNPKGARWDAQCANDGREVNSSWDGVWYVATHIVDDGWYAEFAIPFRTMRFPPGDPQTWGMNFLRRVRRINEDSYWSPVQRIYRIHRLSQAGTIEGLSGLHPGSNLRVKPYALGSSGRIGTATSIQDGQAGIDVKYGVTTGLNWDFTVNTDFSQAEADEQQINLTRFSLLFPEKRDFFLENSGVFQFGPGNERSPGTIGASTGSSGRDSAQQEDVILFFSRRIGLSSAGVAIPILAGTRLTGRVGRMSLGVLNIQQRTSGGVPATNFTVVRARRNVLANSDVGIMAINRQEAGGRYNRVLGTDLNLRPFTSMRVTGLLAKAFSPQATMPGRGEDVTARGGISWLDRFWDVRGSVTMIGRRFLDESGFVRRVGVNKAEVGFGTHWRPKAYANWLRELYPHWQVIDIERRGGGGLDSRYTDYHFPAYFQDGSSVEVGLNGNVENIRMPFTLNAQQGVKIAPGRYEYYEKFVQYDGNRSAPVTPSARYSIGDFYDGTRRAYQVGAAVHVNAHLNMSGTVTRNVITLPAAAYTSNLFTGRVTYSFTTRMFLNALLQYNSDTKLWSSNVRFNIIHRPLSDFYLVYNDRRDSRSGDLFDRSLIAKFTYMIEF